MRKEQTKSLPIISKGMVYGSYLKVCEKKGGAGIDQQSIKMFNVQMADNLYKLWNRMSSGSYFPPPVRTVFIPKKQGGVRPLGIPTVSDRIAQGVVKDYLEPALDKVFHPCSFGYRPLKSAHAAVEQCRTHCRNYAFVVDVDIKGFFDNISHSIMLYLLSKHTIENWVLLYVTRWLQAGVEQEDGSIAARTKGTPQGGVISPLLANLYLHHAFDMWMDEQHPQSPFERYADDIVIHCRNKEEAESILQSLHKRMAEYELLLHPEKTKIVYCGDYRRTEDHDNRSFTFLGFTYQPRMTRSVRHIGSFFLCFRPAISNAAKKHIRDQVRKVINPRWTDPVIEYFAIELNSKIQGWINYYCKIERWEISDAFMYINYLLMKWIKNVYRTDGVEQSWQKLKQIQKENPTLFVHWQYGIKN